MEQFPGAQFYGKCTLRVHNIKALFRTLGEGGACDVLPLRKGGGAEKVLAMLKGGHKTFWGSFYLVA